MSCDQTMLVAPYPEVLFNLLRSVTTPSTWQFTALTFGHAGHLYAGSGTMIMAFFHLYLCEDSKIDNGDLRVYDLSSFKVLRAVKGNGNMISSIVCVKRPGSEFRDAWVASGKQVCTCFSSQSIFGDLFLSIRSFTFNWLHKK